MYVREHTAGATPTAIAVDPFIRYQIRNTSPDTRVYLAADEAGRAAADLIAGAAWPLAPGESSPAFTVNGRSPASRGGAHHVVWAWTLDGGANLVIHSD